MKRTMILMMILAAAAGGCVKVEPIKVEPIHITMDVNIKVDRKLNDFFDFEGGAGDQVPAPAPDKSPPKTGN